MAERAGAVAHRGVLTALRAAAIVIIATGLNDVIAGAEPRYEPLYLYLGAIAVVTWLDGALLGTLAALMAVAFYTLLFVPRAQWLSQAMVLPIAEALGTVIVIGVIRGFVRSRRRATTEIFAAPAMPLLPPPPVVADNTEVLTAIDALREELLARMDEQPGASDNERIAELEHEIADVVAAAQKQGEVSQRALDAAREEVAAKDAVLAQQHARIAELEGEAADAQVSTATHNAELARLHARIAELERELIDAVTTAQTQADASQWELGAAREHASHRVADLERELADVRALAQAHANETIVARDESATLAGRVTELELALSAARVAAASREDDLDNLRRVLETERRRAIALSGEVNDERVSREGVESDNTRLRARIDELEQELAETSTVRDELETARARIAELEAQFDQKLQTIVTHLAADHEADLGKAVEEREEARAEARSVTLKLSVVQRKMDEERSAIAAKLHEADERHRRSLDEAQRQIDALLARVTQLESTPHPVAGRPRILIVYPDADLRLSARGVLERAGYDVVSAADGLEALRTAKAQMPQVVIADAVMPKMDGRELCQLLKSQEKTANIRVILLTRAGDDPPRGDFPPDEVLRKPVPLETLKSTLAALTAS